MPLYGAEPSCKKLRIYEMWLYQLILKIPLKDTNQDVLERVDEEKELLVKIKTQRQEYLGHTSTIC